MCVCVGGGGTHVRLGHIQVGRQAGRKAGRQARRQQTDKIFTSMYLSKAYYVNIVDLSVEYYANIFHALVRYGDGLCIVSDGRVRGQGRQESPVCVRALVCVCVGWEFVWVLCEKFV